MVRGWRNESWFQVGKILRRKDSEVILVRAEPGLPEIPTGQYAAIKRIARAWKF